MEACKECGGKQHVFRDGKWTRCTCWYNAHARRIMGAGGFPLPLLDIESSTLKYTTKGRKQLGAAIRQEVDSYAKSSFFIYSSTIDRDRAAAILVRYLLKKHSEIESALYSKLESLVEDHFNKELTDRPDPLKAEILVISIGEEITNSAHKSLLYNILYDRALHARMTIIISSVMREGLRNRYDDRAASFIEENFKFYEC